MHPYYVVTMYSKYRVSVLLSPKSGQWAVGVASYAYAPFAIAVTRLMFHCDVMNRPPSADIFRSLRTVVASVY